PEIACGASAHVVNDQPHIFQCLAAALAFFARCNPFTNATDHAANTGCDTKASPCFSKVPDRPPIRPREQEVVILFSVSTFAQQFSHRTRHAHFSSLAILRCPSFQTKHTCGEINLADTHP